jgi:DNA-binding NarL/FixJ family response regulator
MDRDGTGIAAALYTCVDPCSFAASHIFFYDVPDDLVALLFEGIKEFSTLYIADSFLNRTCYLGTDVRGWRDITTVRSGTADERGLADALQLNAIEPDGRGCWFGSPQSRYIPIDDDLHLTLTRIGRHLAAAHRLRRKYPEERILPDAAEAIVTSHGRVKHASGVAKEPAKQAILTRAARTMDAVRGRRGKIDPRQAVKEWQSVVAKRWTLLEHFETDGQRLFLAVDNRPAPPSLDLLSEREREIVLRARNGLGNKLIAHELGLADSTVRVLLARAAAKVGARSREELLEKVDSGSIAGVPPRGKSRRT